MKEVLTNYKKQGQQFDIMCCIYPTAPFITAEKLYNSFEKLVSSNADSLMPIVQFSFPPQRAIIIRDDKIFYQYKEFANSRSQDLELLYHDCGQFYFCKVDKFLEYNSVITPNTTSLIMPEEEVQDIDNLSDWNIAEIKYKTFILNKENKNV